MSLRYRAILIDPEDTAAERPKQIFGEDYAEMSHWAEATAAKAVGENAYVAILETKEVEVVRFHKPKTATT